MYNNNNSIAAPTEYLTSPATVATTVGTYIIILFINKYWREKNINYWLL